MLNCSVKPVELFFQLSPMCIDQFGVVRDKARNGP